MTDPLLNAIDASGSICTIADAGAKLLGFGFLGLSVIMIGLGFWLLREVLATPKVAKVKVRAVQFFIMAAFIFMVAAAVLQRFANTQKSTLLVTIQPWDRHDLETWNVHDDIIVRHKQDSLTFKGEPVTLSIEDEGEVSVEIGSLIRAMRALQSQVTITTQQKWGADRSDAGN